MAEARWPGSLVLDLNGWDQTILFRALLLGLLLFWSKAGCERESGYVKPLAGLVGRVLFNYSGTAFRKGVYSVELADLLWVSTE
jgi:hypothetical protein